MAPGKAIRRCPKPAELQGNSTSGSTINPSLTMRQPRAQHGKRFRHFKESLKDYSWHFFAKLRDRRDAPSASSVIRTEEINPIPIHEDLGIPKRVPHSYGTSLRQPTVSLEPMQTQHEMQEDRDTACPPHDTNEGAAKLPESSQQLLDYQCIATGCNETNLPVAASKNDPDLNGVGSHLDYQRSQFEAELSAPSQARGPNRPEGIVPLKPYCRIGSNDSMAKKALVQSVHEQSHASNQSSKSSCDSISRRSTSLSMESSLANDFSRPTSPCKHGEACDSAVSTPFTSVSSFSGTLLEHVRSGDYLREKLLAKRNSWLSNSSTHSEGHLEATMNKRHNPIPSIDANVDSVQDALKVTASLSAPASKLSGTGGWVTQQHLTQPRLVAPTAEDNAKKGDKDQKPFKQGELSPPTKTATAAVVSAAPLSTIEETNSDAGCSTHDSLPKSLDETSRSGPFLLDIDAGRHYNTGSEYTRDQTKSPSIHSKLHGSTPATSVAEGPDSEALEFLDASESDFSNTEFEDGDEDSFNQVLERSDLDSKLHPLLITLKECIVFLVLERVSAWIKSCSPEQDAGGYPCGSGGASGFDSRGSGGNGAESNRRSVKRSLDRGDGDQPDRENGDDQDKRRKMDDTPSNGMTEEQLQMFACPFPKRYPSKEWSKCKKGWPDIHRLKSHIYSVHKQKPYCNRCFREFENETGLIQHQRQLQGCEVNPPPIEIIGITSSMVLQLKNRKGIQNMQGEEYWERIYRIIFPGVVDIPEPYWRADDSTREALRRPKVQAEIARVLGPELVRKLHAELAVPRELLERLLSSVLPESLRAALGSIERGLDARTQTAATPAYGVEPPESPIDQQTLEGSFALHLSSAGESQGSKDQASSVDFSPLRQTFTDIDPSLLQSSGVILSESIDFPSQIWASESVNPPEHIHQFPSLNDMQGLTENEGNLATQSSHDGHSTFPSCSYGEPYFDLGGQT